MRIIQLCLLYAKFCGRQWLMPERCSLWVRLKFCPSSYLLVISIQWNLSLQQPPRSIILPNLPMKMSFDNVKAHQLEWVTTAVTLFKYLFFPRQFIFLECFRSVDDGRWYGWSGTFRKIEGHFNGRRSPEVGERIEEILGEKGRQWRSFDVKEGEWFA